MGTTRKAGSVWAGCRVDAPAYFYKCLSRVTRPRDGEGLLASDSVVDPTSLAGYSYIKRIARILQTPRDVVRGASEPSYRN